MGQEGSKGFCDVDAGCSFDVVKGQQPVPLTQDGQAKMQKAMDMAAEFHDEYQASVGDKPFTGAQPKFLRKPDVISEEESSKRTRVVLSVLESEIKSAARVLVVLGEDCSCCTMWRELVEGSKEDAFAEESATMVALADSWLHTVPRVEKLKQPWQDAIKSSLFIYIGTPGRYLHMCTRSKATQGFDDAYANNRLVVVCRSGVMLPIGTQVESILGTDALAVMQAVAKLVKAKGSVSWGHGSGSKAALLPKLYPGHFDAAKLTKPPPLSALKFDKDTGDNISFDYFVDYVRFTNRAKLSYPATPVTNYYDTGMLVSVCIGSIAEQGVSILTDHDGINMLRDASIGHTMSKLNQLVCVEPQRSTRAVYNFFIGDGACRLNGGMELMMDLIEGYDATPLVTVFLFNNGFWAIEDNLVAHKEEQHVLRNFDYYDLLQTHAHVCICETVLELRATLEYLSRKTTSYLSGKGQPEMRVVIIRGINIDVPPVLGNLDPIMKSSDMAFLKDTLGKFSEGCVDKVPIYGCSAFEYIQFLDLFLTRQEEGKKYQYVCGRTDIQAAHMCGYRQTGGKCVMMINDVYGINSIGESLRSLLSGFDKNQLMLIIWHPTLVRVVDHFHLHRPPMVWPSLGPYLCQFYARTEKDICLFEFQGEPTDKVKEAITKGTPLIVVNMLPEHERNYVNLDLRINLAGQTSKTC